MDKSGGKIVISSSWRHIGYEKIVKVLESNDIGKEYLHEDWATKDLVHQVVPNRHVETNDWLERHPEITHYAVLDDYKLDTPNLVHASCLDGISFENQKQLLKLFDLPLNFYP
jgi:hypothetical protein